MTLQSKKAIITGANRGLVAAVSKVLISNGVTVYGLARRVIFDKDKKDVLNFRFFGL